MNAVFERKIADFKKRLLKKKYEYRQFNTANGIWLKLKIAAAAADKIIGFNFEDNGDLENICEKFQLKKIGNLSSLNREIYFYYLIGNLNFLKRYQDFNELTNDIPMLLSSDYNSIIFCENILN